MKVLMVTPRVDESHDILGFIPGWLRELAERVDKLYVITLQYNTETPLPENVIVYSVYRLGEKWDRASKPIRLIRLLARRMYFNIIMLRIIPKVDVVFCHMYPEFTIRAAPYAKVFRKPIVTWYAHGHVSRRLRIAHFFSNKMVTSSKEGLRIKSNKIIITSQGIDTNRFKPAVNLQRKKDKINILSVGRISPIKDYETLIKAAYILVNGKGMKDLEFVIVGAVPMASQEEYYQELERMVRQLELENYVKFVGCVPYSNVLGYYQECDLFVSTSQTGSVDKVVLEAMACEKPVVVCNEAFGAVFGDYSEMLIFENKNSLELANRIMSMMELGDFFKNRLCQNMREIVVENHSVERLMNEMVMIFKDCSMREKT